MMNKIGYILIYFIFQIQYLSAQQYIIRKYTTADGLPSNSLYGAFQDSRDFIWICGQGGFSRFDGKKFHNYNSGNIDSISNMDVVFEDSTGNLWGNTVWGPYKFDGKYFTQYTFDSKPENLWVTQQFVSKKKKVWVTLSSGIYELENNLWRKLPFIESDTNVFYNQVVELNGDRLLFNFRDSLCIYNKNKTLQRIPCINELYPIFKSVRTHHGELLIFSNKHVYKFHNDSLIVLYPEELNGFVTGLLLDRDGKLWVAIDSEVIKVFDYYGSLKKPIFKLEIPGSVYGFLQDKNNNMWISGLSGLYKLTPRFVKFIPLPQKEICNIFKAGNGKIIAGRINGEPLIYENDSFIPVSKKYKFRINTLYAGAWMRLLTVDSSNRIWMGNFRNKLYHIEENLISDISGIFTTANRQMGAIAYNAADNAVYLSGDSGIVKIIDNRIVKTFQVFNDPNEYVYSMKADRAGRMWFLNNRKNAGMGYIKDDLVVYIKNSYTSVYASSKFYFDQKGFGYLCTSGQGVYKFHLATPDSIIEDFHFHTRNGFVSNVINAVDFDNSGRMWVASVAGIFSIRMMDSLNYNVSEYNLDRLTGITDWYLSDLAFDGNDRIYFSAVDGAGYFECDKVIENNTPPKVYINSVNIANQETDWKLYSTALIPFFFIPINPQLPFSMNQLLIGYTASCFSESDEIVYSYNISGTDSSWIYNSTTASASLINLSPGDYVFKVRARTGNTTWGEPDLFAFTINPPWWRSWWFYTILTALCFAGLQYYLRFRKNQSTKEILTQQKLHNLEQQSLRAQMNPHFIFNSLHSINEYVQHNKANLASEYLVNFSKLMRAILDNSRKREVVLAEELDVLELYIQLEAKRMEFPFTYTIYVDNKILPGNTLIPPMLLQPVIENAIWHGLAPLGRPGHITLRIIKKDMEIICDITDNGVGRIKSNGLNRVIKQESYGLKITAERLAIIEQIKNMNTNLTFTDLFSAGVASGLKVTFTLPYEEAN